MVLGVLRPIFGSLKMNFMCVVELPASVDAPPYPVLRLDMTRKIFDLNGH